MRIYCGYLKIFIMWSSRNMWYTKMSSREIVLRALRRGGALFCCLLLALSWGVKLRPLAALEAALIDFSRLAPDTPAANPEDNSATLVGFDDLYISAVGLSLSNEEKEQIRLSLAIPSWTILLNASARNIYNTRNSSIREVAAQPSSSQFAGESLLGVRVTFPSGFINSWALIEPPYRIPRTTLSRLRNGNEINYDGVGRLRNVGQIQSIALESYGLNYPHKVSVLIEGANGVIQEYILGNLQFEGWNTLVWENPNYVAADDENQVAPQLPLYPRNVPVIAFRGIRIYKNALYPDSSFVGYFKEVRVTYDEIGQGPIGEIDNEGTWNILREQEERVLQREYYRSGGSQELYRNIQDRLRHKGE